MLKIGVKWLSDPDYVENLTFVGVWRLELVLLILGIVDALNQIMYYHESER